MSSLADPCRSNLASRLREDLSQRWHAGDPVRVESYLTQYPDLSNDSDVLLELILAEAFLREEHGEAPSLDEYLSRFPKLADLLRQQWNFVWIGRPAVNDRTASDQITQPIPPLPQLPSLPGFEILGQLGRGGMGVVYRARDRLLDREVAIKLIRTGTLASNEETQRFQTEARASARLRHPHVVQVLSFQEHDGFLYLVMEQMTENLATRLKRGMLSTRETVVLVRDLARAVQAAHDANIVHRDLKPSNILLDEHGTAKIGDFGLARLMDIDSELTCTEMVLGTPAYMSPEQAHGKTAWIGPHSDIWALGVILYECLTSRPPFKGKNRSETLELVRNADPAPLVHVPADLEAICLHCLEKEPKKRYATAAELADDLDRWLNGAPLLVRPLTRLQRARRWVKRRRGLVALALISFVLAISAGAIIDLQDPYRPMREVVADLQMKKAVSLIPEGGRPRWSHWVVGEATQTTDQEGNFCIETWTRSYLELLRDPSCEYYRFEAKIRPVRGMLGSSVGLVVGHYDFPLGPDLCPFYIEVVYSDMYDEGQNRIDVLTKAKAPNIPKAPQPNWVRMQGVMELGRGIRGAGSSRFSCGAGPGFFWNENAWKNWRHLVIEVTPSQLHVFLDSNQIMRVSADKISVRGQMAWRNATVRKTEFPNLPSPGRFEPRGGLGLIVDNGAAAFKDVTVQPLQQ